MRLSMRIPPRAFVRDARAGASMELGLGVVVLLGIALLCFDLYARVTAETASMRVAATMADYVSRDTETQGPGSRRAGRVPPRARARRPGRPGVRDQRVAPALRPPMHSLRSRSCGPAPTSASATIWTSSRRTAVATSTRRANASLPDAFVAGMKAGEAMVVAEICARLRREGSLTRPLHRRRHLPGLRPAGTRSGCAPFPPDFHDTKRRRPQPRPGPNPDSRRVSARPRASAPYPPRAHEDAAARCRCLACRVGSDPRSRARARHVPHGRPAGGFERFPEGATTRGVPPRFGPSMGSGPSPIRI